MVLSPLDPEQLWHPWLEKHKSRFYILHSRLVTGFWLPNLDLRFYPFIQPCPTPRITRVETTAEHGEALKFVGSWDGKTRDKESTGAWSVPCLSTIVSGNRTSKTGYFKTPWSVCATEKSLSMSSKQGCTYQLHGGCKLWFWKNCKQLQ